MYDVTVKTGFAAAHQLRLYDGKYENLHGQNWTAQVPVEADELDNIGVGIDLVEINRFKARPYSTNKSFYKKIFSDDEIDYCLK